MSGGAGQGRGSGQERGSGQRGVALEETGMQLAEILRRALAVRVAKRSDRTSTDGGLDGAGWVGGRRTGR
jgi:hypothetical protein